VILRNVFFFFAFFRATRRVVGHEAHENEWYIVIKAYKFTIFEIFRFFCIIVYLYYRMLHVNALPTYRVKKSGEDHASLEDDTKLQLKQPNLG